MLNRFSQLSVREAVPRKSTSHSSLPRSVTAMDLERHNLLPTTSTITFTIHSKPTLRFALLCFALLVLKGSPARSSCHATLRFYPRRLAIPSATPRLSCHTAHAALPCWQGSPQAPWRPRWIGSRPYRRGWVQRALRHPEVPIGSDRSAQCHRFSCTISSRVCFLTYNTIFCGLTKLRCVDMKRSHEPIQ